MCLFCFTSSWSEMCLFHFDQIQQICVSLFLQIHFTLIRFSKSVSVYFFKYITSNLMGVVSLRPNIAALLAFQTQNYPPLIPRRVVAPWHGGGGGDPRYKTQWMVCHEFVFLWTDPWMLHYLLVRWSWNGYVMSLLCLYKIPQHCTSFQGEVT